MNNVIPDHLSKRSLLASGGLLLALVIIAGTAGAWRTHQVESEPPNPRWKIIPYVFGGRIDLAAIPAEKITHINYAFATINDQGEFYFRSLERAAHIAQLQSLKARNPDLKVIISVGGGGSGSEGFSDASLTPASREKLVLSGIKMIKDYAFDGIDLDWEFPGVMGRNITTRPEDEPNFTSLVILFREHLDRLSDERGLTGDDRYTLTMASSTDHNAFETTEMGKVHQYMDWINIMTYDFFGPRRVQVTGHHTGLHPSEFPGADPRSASYSVQKHLEAGIPKEKLVIGAAFYGKQWTGVNPANDGRNQQFGQYINTRRYNVLVEEYINKRGFRWIWDEAAQAPYLWNPDSTTWITYDDAESVQAKAEYIMKEGLGGMMWWEQSGDHNNELLNAAYETFN